MSLNETTFLDLQGFKDAKNGFLAREVAVCYSMRYELVNRIMVRQPYNFKELPLQFKKINSWVTRNHHGMAWTDKHGDDPNYVFLEIYQKHIQHGNSNIVVKGVEKVRWLTHILEMEGVKGCVAIHDIEDLGMPSLEVYKSKKEHEVIMNMCDAHNKYTLKRNMSCAVANVNFMMLYIQENMNNWKN